MIFKIFEKDYIMSTEEPKPEQKNILQKAAKMASSVASRGINNKTCSPEVKELRKLSCHGDDTLPPCSQRKSSEKFEGSFFCGACGCGDKQGTQLTDITIAGKSNYGKLDYPKVWCPLNMPGFQPYKATNQEAPEVQNYRKKEIENRFSIEYITEKSKQGESTK
jgi:hypothetical protein